MSNTNRELIHRFYTAFARRDAEAMAACYLPEVTFRDPVFELQGAEVGDMWRMLCTRGKDLTLEFADVQADAMTGSANWVANYTFSATGRHVENRIHATFRFRDGLIADHIDAFSFWRWSRQALGLPGVLLGWTPMLRKKVQTQARVNLDRFRAERAAAGA
jgi:ketosteroid isomerase-like protein